MLQIEDAWRTLVASDRPPIMHELRNCCPGRWVRFHSLPESKRYAESDAEYTEILHRHNTIISSLADVGDSLHLVTSGFSNTPNAVRPYSELTDIDPDAMPWRSVRIEHQWYFHVFTSELIWSPGALNPLLLLVADDSVREIGVIDGDGQWAYHPYDGGGDVICPTEQCRADLMTRYPQWLSSHPNGL